LAGASLSGWLDTLAAATATSPQRRRSCILLWMNGGPSTIDLWDLKPGHENGGPYKEIEAAPDLKIGEHLPKLAKHGKSIAVLRGIDNNLCSNNSRSRGAIVIATLGCTGASESRIDRARYPR